MALMWPLALGALLNAPPFPRGASRSHRHATMLAVDLATRFSELRGHLSTAQQHQLDLLQKDTEKLASEKLAAEKLATMAEKKATLAARLATTAEQLAIMKGKELQQQTGSLVTQLCVYKGALENRHLLERAAEIIGEEDYDDVYAHLGSNAPNRLLILNKRYRHIFTWRPGVGQCLSKAALQVELEKKTVVQLRQQCKDQGLSVSGSENELVQRLLAATEAEDDLETWVESRLTEAEDDLEAPAPTEAAPAAAAASPGRLRAAAAAAWQGLGRWIPTN